MSAVEEKLKEYMPLVKEKLALQLGNAKDAAGNVPPPTLVKALRAVHGTLPRTVRFVIKEDKFVDFCLTKKSLLIDGVDLTIKDDDGGKKSFEF